MWQFTVAERATGLRCTGHLSLIFINQSLGQVYATYIRIARALHAGSKPVPVSSVWLVNTRVEQLLSGHTNDDKVLC